MKQLKLNLNKGKRGGRREGSGRKRLHSPGVAHRSRARVSHRFALHINFKYRRQIKNKASLRLLKRAILNARSHGLRIIHFSMQSNHVHLIVESACNAILTKGMRSLTVTMAKGLNDGKVQLERYHLHVLRTLKETRNAVFYVCFNKQKHENKKFSIIDDYSSYPGTALIRQFTRRSRMCLKIGSREKWIGDRVRSFFLRKALTDST